MSLKEWIRYIPTDLRNIHGFVKWEKQDTAKNIFDFTVYKTMTKLFICECIYFIKQTMMIYVLHVIYILHYFKLEEITEKYNRLLTWVPLSKGEWFVVGDKSKRRMEK